MAVFNRHSLPQSWILNGAGENVLDSKIINQSKIELYLNERMEHPKENISFSWNT